MTSLFPFETVRYPSNESVPAFNDRESGDQPADEKESTVQSSTFRSMPLWVRMRRFDERAVPEISSKQEEKSVADKIPYDGSLLGRGGEKTAAVDVQPAHGIENQGRKEGKEQEVCQGDGPRKPFPQSQERSQNELDPRQDDGCRVDKLVRKDLVIADSLRKRERLVDLLKARKDKDSSKNHSNPEKKPFSD